MSVKVNIETTSKSKIVHPKMYKVIMLNDDYTTMEFVVEILMVIFQKDFTAAQKIMLDVHNKGRGEVGVYSYDIAQSKISQVHSIARQKDFPLRCLLEEA